MKKILVTYADSHPALITSQQELVKQSKPYFNGYASFNKQNIDSIYYEKNKRILEQKRGSGYWLWKPYAVDKVLSVVDEGDIVFYIDSGNAIVGDLEPLFEICKTVESGVVLFENRDGNPLRQIWDNKQWTKRDCFIKMGCDSQSYHDGPQCSASIQIYRKCEKSVQFVKEYLEWCEDEDVLTDIPCKRGSNLPTFTDHRHDQSVLSLLSIKYNIKLWPNPSETGEGSRPPDCTYKSVLWHHRGTIYGRR